MWKSAIALSATLLLACKGTDEEASHSKTTAGSGSSVARVEQALAEIVATAAESIGTVEVRRQGQVRWERVALGATFRERDWVRTGSGSFVRLRFSTRGFVDLRENTTLLVDQAITVETGSLVAVAEGDQPMVVKAADGSEARISAAPGGPVEVRITPTASQGVEIAVTKGNVKLTTKGGEIAIAAGSAVDVAKDRTGDIVKLLGFPVSAWPGVDARFLFAADLKIPLSWKSIPGGRHYHVQIARDTEFHALVFSGDVQALSKTFTPESKGIYAWRVAGRDGAGRLGEFGFARRIYVEGDEPRDLLIGPRDGFKIEYPNTAPQVDFSWRPEGDAKKYKLVIHRGTTGQDPVITETTTAQRFSVKLDDGVYSWGVYALKADHEDPIFLSLRRLTIAKQQGPTIKTEVQWNQPKK